MTNTDKLEASLIYPREVKIRDGRNVSLRLMEAGDNQRILNFAELATSGRSPVPTYRYHRSEDN